MLKTTLIKNIEIAENKQKNTSLILTEPFFCFLWHRSYIDIGPTSTNVSQRIQHGVRETTSYLLITGTAVHLD